ncbi:MAG: glycosyltransferase family 4 protein [Marivibrio sp.]|uniref:glycosyltransferase family 4 protein n=1 Tax=Marivibrio sp. TaxID=2039719 RepID=UPI0032EF13DC
MAHAGPESDPAPPDGARAAKPRTLLQVVPSLVTGGVERGTVDVAAAAARAGYRSIVASGGGPMVRELLRAGAEHIERPLQSKNPLTLKRNAQWLAELVGREGVDLVHARSRAPAWSAYWAAQRTQTPFVTTFHGTYSLNAPGKKSYNSVMTRGDRVIAISSFIAEHIRTHYELDATRLRTIPRGIDAALYDPEAVSAERVIRLAERWRLPDGMPIVLLPGRLTRWKGQLLLIKALTAVEEGPVRCLLVGSSQGREAYRRELEATARELGVADMVHVIEDCDDMPAAYKLADVVVSASTDPEAFGRVAVEGQAMGRPVIAPRHGGAVDQVREGETGWLFKPSDPYDLALKIDLALKLSPEARAAMHAAGVENARTRFTKERMCADTLKVYDELLGPMDGPAGESAT